MGEKKRYVQSTDKPFRLCPLTYKSPTLLSPIVCSSIATLLSLSIGWSLEKQPVSARPLPDNTLGAESSIVTPINDIRDLIEGGAIRGSNLFHSFESLDIDEGQEAYFANPIAITNILSRVTGNDVSDIFGTLGVNGSANLFLLNPNGIIFGPNARLDIGGSFVASTAESFGFEDGSEFRAIDWANNPLLTVSVPMGLQSGATPRDNSVIASQANLLVGQNLVLLADTLDLQGQIIASGDLNLLGTETIRIRDTQLNPFVAASGKNLLVQGNETVDIFALNHPQSGFFAIENLTLRSAAPIGGDAHYLTRGSFRIEQLDGTLGDMYSPHDPIIRSFGDVSFNNYFGTSLHIFAGGSVTANYITITGPDTGELGVDFIRENIQLSNGNNLLIDGGRQPTIDIRAGMDPSQINNAGLTGVSPTTDFFYDFFFAPFPPFLFPVEDTPILSPTPTNADINVSDIEILAPDGLVYLTNQYQPNLLIDGDITIRDEGPLGFGINTESSVGDGGDVIIDSRGDIAFTRSPLPQFLFFGINSASTMDSGDISLISKGTISMNGSLTDSVTLGDGDGGDIFIEAANLELDRSAVIRANSETSGQGGDIEINVDQLNILGGSTIFSRAFSTGNGGNIAIVADDSVTVSGRIGATLFASGISTDTDGDGQAGDITITTPSLIVRDGAAISTDTNNAGQAGNLTINAGNLLVELGGQLTAKTQGSGEGGTLTLNVDESIDVIGTLEGQSIFPSSVSTESRDVGRSGNLIVNTQRLRVEGGGILTTLADNQGDGGSLDITATESVEVIGRSFDDAIPSGIATDTFGQGRAGELNITTPELLASDGSRISSATAGSGDASALNITADQVRIVDGAQVFASANDDGNGSTITITANDVVQVSGSSSAGTESRFSKLSAETFSNGNSGDLVIVTPRLQVDDGAEITAAVAADAQGNGGDIEIQATTLQVNNDAQIRADTASAGTAGDIIITSDNVVVNNNAQITVETQGAGIGGDLEVSAQNLTLQDGGRILASATDTAKEAARAGSVTINSALVRVIGQESGIFAETEGVVPAGTLALQPLTGQQNLTVEFQDGGQVSAATRDSGAGGDLNIQAPESITLRGPGSLVVETTGSGSAGTITFSTNHLTIEDGLTISAATSDGVGGNILVEDASTVRIDNSTITSEVRQGGTNANIQGGDIRISGGDIRIVNGSNLRASTNAAGNAGNVIIENANNVLFDDSVATSEAGSDATGSGQNVDIQSQNLRLLNDSQLTASTRSSGNAGEVNIRVDDTVLFDNSTASTDVGNNASGNGGDVRVFAPRIELINGSDVNAATRGAGDAGDVTLRTRHLAIEGDSSITVSTVTEGQAGQITLNQNQAAADTLQLRNGRIETKTDGDGNAGGIVLNTQQLLMEDGSAISASTQSSVGGDIVLREVTTAQINESSISSSAQTGTAGSVTINGNEGDSAAEQIVIQGNTSEIAARAERKGGSAGDINLNSQELLIQDGAEISASNISGEQGGNINLSIDDTLQLEAGSGISATTRSGIGGSVIVQDVNVVQLENGSRISSSAQTGQAGNVSINADETAAEQIVIQGNNSEIAARTERRGGSAGNVTLNSQNLLMQDGAEISASNISSETGGNINLTIDEVLQLQNGSDISATTRSGRGGNITIQGVNDVQLENGSRISSSARTGRAGSVGINVDDPAAEQIVIQGNNSEIAARAERKGGRAGDVTLNSQNLLMQDRAEISALNISGERGGNINLSIDDTLRLQNRSGISTTTQSGVGGSVTIEGVNDVQLENGSRISSSAQTGQAGSVSINAGEPAAEQIDLQQDSEIAVRATDIGGSAGNININSQELLMQDRAEISASNISGENRGNINLTVDDTLQLQNGSTISATTQSGVGGNVTVQGVNDVQIDNSTITSSANNGRAGDISLGAEETIQLSNHSTLSVETGVEQPSDNTSTDSRSNSRRPLNTARVDDESTAIAGNLSIRANRLEVENGSSILVSSPNGQAGSVNIATNQMFLSNSEVRATTFSDAVNGEDSANVDINSSELIILENDSLISAEAIAGADGGNITLNAEDGFIIAFPRSNSDIIANAVGGDGGRIDITTQRLLGLRENSGEFDELRANRTNDMSVSSTLGTSGVIAVNDLGLDPVQAAGELPMETAQSPLSQGCEPGSDRGSFTNTEQGGIPSNPDDPIANEDAWEDIHPPEVSPEAVAIAEAGEWHINEEGQIVLQENAETSSVQLTCKL